MESKRQKKFNRMLQKDLGEIFQRNAHDWFNGAFITVTNVLVSPDLGLAKVYLSFMLAKDKEAMMQQVEAHKKAIRQQLGARIRNQVKAIPELNFYIDDTEEVSAKIDELFENLDIPPESDDDDLGPDYKK